MGPSDKRLMAVNSGVRWAACHHGSVPRQQPTIQRVQSDSLTGIAALITIAGGSGLLIDQLFGIPAALGAIALLLFLVGWVTAVFAAVVDARRNDRTVPEALWGGFKTVFTWLFWFMP